jgi:hypothetical protein
MTGLVLNVCVEGHETDNKTDGRAYAFSQKTLMPQTADLVARDQSNRFAVLAHANTIRRSRRKG